MDSKQIMSLIAVMLGIYGVATSRNIVKSILCLQVMESSIILLFLSFADKPYSVPPIYPANAASMVDPLPQALMITTIIIGSSINALALMLSIKIYHKFNTLNWDEIMQKEH